MNETGIWTGILNKKLGTFKFIYVEIIESTNIENHINKPQANDKKQNSPLLQIETSGSDSDRQFIQIDEINVDKPAQIETTTYVFKAIKSKSFETISKHKLSRLSNNRHYSTIRGSSWPELIRNSNANFLSSLSSESYNRTANRPKSNIQRSYSTAQLYHSLINFLIRQQSPSLTALTEETFRVLIFVVVVVFAYLYILNIEKKGRIKNH
jgi:hypothetical protein